MSNAPNKATVAINYEINEMLHRALKTQAAFEGITLKEVILRYLAEGLAQDGEFDVLDAVVGDLSDKARERWTDLT
jgi:hypothetical protein